MAGDSGRTGVPSWSRLDLRARRGMVRGLGLELQAGARSRERRKKTFLGGSDVR